ncbi:Unsaturated glucuronyl hydrolase [Vanrija pseudolonga]|uniref:Unsaturated glucuronyl hydrolase n=1 Tax=Vanrija pseudolonga TaxID=143232 RepID=A0AAF0Y7H8_9TREE|nr:Unsaturated glucuronyl hydrolase [Vanrija pseudolonga]
MPTAITSPSALLVSVPDLLDISDSIKIVSVAEKYDNPKGPNGRVPEYTVPQGPPPHAYHCSKVETSWTQGFFPGLLWLLVERRRLARDTVYWGYNEDRIAHLAHRFQDGFRHMATDAFNHDQGFRFQLSYGKGLELEGSKDTDARQAVIEAADSLVARYDDNVGCIRSWDSMRKVGEEDVWRLDNMDEHYLVIIDNMMNLDLLYLASELTGDPHYATIATRQADKSLTAHIRPDGTTYHVVDFNQDGTVKKSMTHQGYADESTWSRGQAWAAYGYAQCALRTGRKDFVEVTRKVVDKFIALLGPSGVPEWDFDAPRPAPYDASAATITARAMQMLYTLLKDSEPDAAGYYLARGFRLIADVLRECKTPAANIVDGVVDFGEDGWETILQHSTINGNRHSPRKIMDHGLVYADFYLVQFGNEALKMALEEKL